jgi:HK97 family phage major capsid protein
MSKQLRALQDKKAKLVADARAITDKAAAENRDLTEDESKGFDALSDSIKKTNASIDREQVLIAEESQLGPAAAAPSKRIAFGEGRDHVMADDDNKRGFRSFGEFAQKVRVACAPGGGRDQRLTFEAAAPGTYGNESGGTDGGYLVPPDFAKEIFMLSLEGPSLLAKTDQVEITGNSMVFPKDETTPWGTDGIRAYWQAEAAAATATKPKLGVTIQRLHKLMALVPISDEMLEDTNALESYLPKKTAISIRWKSDESILFGLGNGVPLGCMNSNAVITQAKESGQATATLLPQNIAKMVSRMPDGSYGRAVWIINNDVLPALFTLTLNNYPIYLPFGGGVGTMEGSPFGNILGRPVIVSQHAKSFSSQGDVMLLDLDYQRSVLKAGGMETATSMHLYFDADATAFRTTFRLDSQPKILNQIQPQNGSNVLSPFVQLGAR